ncbi:MAG: HlyC/CorC family transporter [Candidatus Omnitrophica bacterium]|nr:HlyC/CorC family transporter [Candidatus Omnitrophota bacterium]
MPIFIEILIVLVMLVLNGIFAAYEMALASASKARLMVLAGRKIRGAEEAVFMKDNIEASLAVAQLGVTVSTAIAAATGGLSASDILSPWLVQRFHFHPVMADVMALVFWVVPLSSVTIIFSELLPKLFALRNRERICLQLSPFMKSLYHALTPVVGIFERAVKGLMPLIGQGKASVETDHLGLHELQAATALARTSRLIGAHQEKIVLAAAQLSARSVKEILIPIGEVSTIPLSSSLSQALILAHMDMHTRFPVCAREGDLQSIAGYLNFKDIISALRLNPSDPSVKGIVRPIKSVDAGHSISQALEAMITEKLHIILVTGKGGAVAGIVTLEDIIEELVGEIEDEFDRMPNHIHPFTGGWIMGGGVHMSVVAGTTGVDLPVVSSQERLSDWCARHAVVPLKGGEFIEAEGLRVIPRKFRRHQVSEAAVAPLAALGGKDGGGVQ